jgi:hypothetical protein
MRASSSLIIFLHSDTFSVFQSICYVVVTVHKFLERILTICNTLPAILSTNQNIIPVSDTCQRIFHPSWFGHHTLLIAFSFWRTSFPLDICRTQSDSLIGIQARHVHLLFVDWILIFLSSQADSPHLLSLIALNTCNTSLIFLLFFVRTRRIFSRAIIIILQQQRSHRTLGAPKTTRTRADGTKRDSQSWKVLEWQDDLELQSPLCICLNSKQNMEKLVLRRKVELVVDGWNLTTPEIFRKAKNHFTSTTTSRYYIPAFQTS